MVTSSINQTEGFDMPVRSSHDRIDEIEKF